MPSVFLHKKQTGRQGSTGNDKVKAPTCLSCVTCSSPDVLYLLSCLVCVAFFIFFLFTSLISMVTELPLTILSSSSMTACTAATSVTSPVHLIGLPQPTQEISLLADLHITGAMLASHHSFSLSTVGRSTSLHLDLEWYSIRPRDVNKICWLSR